jgi:hypothetical protein
MLVPGFLGLDTFSKNQKFAGEGDSPQQAKASLLWDTDAYGPSFVTTKKHNPRNVAVPFLKDSQRKRAVPVYQVKKAFWSKPNEFLRYTKDIRRTIPLTQLLWPIHRVSWPVTSPCFA